MTAADTFGTTQIQLISLPESINADISTSVSISYELVCIQFGQPFVVGLLV